MSIPRSWKQRDQRPFNPAEDAAIMEVASIGLCASHIDHAFNSRLPERRFGDVLERRNQLAEMGLLQMRAPL